MPTPLEQLTEARAEIARLQGIETQFNALQAQIPAGGAAGLTTLLAEHGQFKANAARLTGEVGILTTRATTAEGEVSRLNGEIETVRASVDQRAEERAAEIVAATGNQAPAAADTNGAVTTGKPAVQRSSQEHWNHYATLSAEEKNVYYRTHSAAMNK